MKTLSRSKQYLLVIAAAVASMLWIATPAPAYAQAPQLNLNLEKCANDYNDEDFTVKIVSCIQNSIQDITINMLSMLSQYMAPVVGAALTLAICIFGARILVGNERELLPQATGFILRAVIVLMFSANLGGFASSLFAIEGELISLTGPSPFAATDQILGDLLGFSKDYSSISQGILGLVGAALPAALGSNMIASTLFIPGIAAIFGLLKFVMTMVGTYLKAIMGIGFMTLVWTILAPSAFFHYGERYVKKTIDITLGIMILPPMLFILTGMGLQMVQAQTGQIFTDLGVDKNNHDMHSFEKMNMPVYAWLMPTDPNMTLQEQGVEAGAGDPKIMGAINNAPASFNPFLSRAMNNDVNVPGIDFGDNNPGMTTLLMRDFAALGAIVMLLNAAVTSLLPQVVGSIAGVVSGLGVHSSPPLQEQARAAMSNIKTGFSAIMGGGAGGELGAAATGRRGRKIGGVAGGILGALKGG